MKQKQKKRPLTLLEIMIVIFLIGLIGSVVGYSMKGSIDEGRVFKTKQSAAQLRDLLMLEVAKATITMEDAISKPLDCLEKRTNVLKDPKKLLQDGWNENFKLDYKYGDIQITSAKYNEYCKKKGITPDEL